MQLECLKVFCDVIRNQSFSQAALENHVTQSAVSQMVSQLEKRLGVVLINRPRRPFTLTREGQLYYQGCRKLLEQYLELEASIRKAPPELPVTVRVAAIYSVGLGDMGQHVERFEAQNPNARIQIEYLHPDRVTEKVLDGSADLGLVSFPPRSRALRTLPWREEEMLLTCSPRHPLARYPAIRPEQLAGEKYVGFSRELTIRRKVDQFLRAHKVAVDMAVELDNIQSIKEAIEDSGGVALLPEPTLRRELQAGTLAAVPLLGCHLVRPLGIILRRHHQLSSSAWRFIALLQHPEATTASNGAAPQASGVNGRAETRRLPLSSQQDGALGSGKARPRSPAAYRGRNGTTRTPKQDR